MGKMVFTETRKRERTEGEMGYQGETPLPPEIAGLLPRLNDWIATRYQELGVTADPQTFGTENVHLFRQNDYKEVFNEEAVGKGGEYISTSHKLREQKLAGDILLIMGNGTYQDYEWQGLPGAEKAMLVHRLLHEMIHRASVHGERTEIDFEEESVESETVRSGLATKQAGRKGTKYTGLNEAVVEVTAWRLMNAHREEICAALGLGSEEGGQLDAFTHLSYPEYTNLLTEILQKATAISGERPVDILDSLEKDLYTGRYDGLKKLGDIIGYRGMQAYAKMGAYEENVGRLVNQSTAEYIKNILDYKEKYNPQNKKPQ
jgi:hypothetical protein